MQPLLAPDVREQARTCSQPAKELSKFRDVLQQRAPNRQARSRKIPRAWVIELENVLLIAVS